MKSYRLARILAAASLLCLVLASCRHEITAPGDPVAAVKGLAAALHDNDLVRYSRLSMPPELHKKMEERWHARLALAPAPTAAQAKDYDRIMGRLLAADADAKLYASLDPKLARLEKEIGTQWPMMRATASIFINGVIQANDRLTPAEKAHAKAVGEAVTGWAGPELLTDRERAKQAIAVLTATARELALPHLAQARQLDMVPALEKGGIVLKGLKRLGRVYGVDGDAALAGVEVKLLSVDGDIATMQVAYPLLGRRIEFEMEMIRRDQRWYSADAVRGAEAELAQPLSAPAAP